MGGLNTYKKKYFRQKEHELHYYDSEKSDESGGFINLLDVINIFPDGKAKQGSFVIVTQSRSWKLQAIGDDPDAERAKWLKALENWLNENRKGFKKLKKMGFDKPTTVSVGKRGSINTAMNAGSGDLDKAAVTSTRSEPDEQDRFEVWGMTKLKATALDFRRLELQIKIAP